MDRFEDLLKRNKKLKEDSKLIQEDMDMIIAENKRVINIAQNSRIILNDIDKKFAEATKLDMRDTTFLFFAVAMQCLRQYLFTSFEERTNHNESEKKSKQKEKELFKKYGKQESQGEKTSQYYSSINDIMKKGVPYDAQFGSQDFNLKLSGEKHRFRTLGHDPLFGWVFGTANIMTNTLTDWNIKSYHVEPAPKLNGVMMPKIVQTADTIKMLNKMKTRALEEPKVLAAALIKQGLHIKSDEYSKVGLPVPGMIMLSPDFAQKIAEYGVDAGNLKGVGKQVTFAVLINTIIAMIHGLFYDARKNTPLDLYKVKTRKILMYSNIISSVSNLIVVAIESALKGKMTLKHLDVGGFFVTIYRIVSDVDFITNVKTEFIYNNFNSLVQGDEYSFKID